MQLVLQHCCKTSWIAVLRILPATFKSVNNLICCKTGLMWVLKCNIAIQLVLQQCCKKSCAFFVRFSVPLCKSIWSHLFPSAKVMWHYLISSEHLQFTRWLPIVKTNVAATVWSRLIYDCQYTTQSSEWSEIMFAKIYLSDVRCVVWLKGKF